MADGRELERAGFTLAASLAGLNASMLIIQQAIDALNLNPLIVTPNNR